MYWLRHCCCSVLGDGGELKSQLSMHVLKSNYKPVLSPSCMCKTAREFESILVFIDGIFTNDGNEKRLCVGVCKRMYIYISTYIPEH